MVLSLNQLYKKSGKTKPFKQFAEEYNNATGVVIEDTEIIVEDFQEPEVDDYFISDDYDEQPTQQTWQPKIAIIDNTVNKKELAACAVVGFVLGVTIVLLVTNKK